MIKDILSLNSYKVLKVKGCYYLFDIYNMDCCYLSEELGQKILIKDYEHIEEKYIKIFKKLENDGLFFYNIRNKFPEIYKYNKINFSLSPVHKCNLACKYCFAEQGNNFKGYNKKFDKSTICQIGKFLINTFNEINNFRLDFVSGGEPLYDKDLLKYTISNYRELFKKEEKELYIWLCTNGTLIDDSILDFLDSNNVKLGISLDGDKITNDKNRVYSNGAGTYEDIKKTIKLIKNKNSLSKNIREIWGLAVICSDNIDFINILNHHAKIGFSSVQMKFARLEKNKLLSINKDDVNRILYSVDNLLDIVFTNMKKKIVN